MKGLVGVPIGSSPDTKLTSITKSISDYEASNCHCSHYRRNEQPILFNLFLNRYLLFQRSDPNVRLVSRLTDFIE